MASDGVARRDRFFVRMNAFLPENPRAFPPKIPFPGDGEARLRPEDGAEDDVVVAEDVVVTEEPLLPVVVVVVGVVEFEPRVLPEDAGELLDVSSCCNVFSTLFPPSHRISSKTFLT